MGHELPDIAITPAFRIRGAMGNLSFSWYCRRPAADTAGTAARMGDAMLGLAAVASTRPAWAGTAAATLLNMVAVDMRRLLVCNPKFEGRLGSRLMIV